MSGILLGPVASSRRRTGGGTPVILGNNVKGSAISTVFATRMYVSQFTLASAKTLNELHGWFLGTWNGTIRLVIYADSADAPAARLAYTSALAYNGSADVELVETGFSVSLAAGNYWIGWECPTLTSGSPSSAGSATGTYNGKTTGAADPPDNPFGSVNASGARNHSCWAVVT